MNNPTAKFLKAYIRIDGSGRDVPSSLIYRKNKPTVGKWREVNSYECCITPTSTTTTTGYPCPTICALGDIVIGDQTWTGCNLDVTKYQTGTPTLSLCGESCGTTLNGNVLEVTYANPNGGASLVQVGSTNSYTQITITGPGGGDGSTISLCLDDVTPPLDCTSCNVVALPNAIVGGIGTVTYGDLIINTTYSGPTLNNAGDFITCTGKTTPLPCLILGNNVGDFTYTLNFNKPVNNIKLLFAGGGVAPGPPYIEYYTFTTNDGDEIPQVQDPAEFAALTTGAWCYYDNDPLNGCVYGKLYNGYAITDPRGLAPAGYHVPTDSDFYTLMTYLSPGGTGAVNDAGGKLKETGFNHWFPNNLGATNSSGWTGLPGGSNENGTFSGLGLFGVFWTTTPFYPDAYTDALYYWELYNWNDLTISELFEQKGYYKRSGNSVRLIKDSCPPCSLPDVTIGTQTWTGCNLNIDTYQNGDPIPQVQDPTAWAALTTGAWCYYDNDDDNGCTYGKLYNWYAVTDPRNIAPLGWHIPTDAECTTLVNYLGGLSVAGGPLKEAGTVHWASPNVGATNSTGFTFLPGGLRNAYVGDFTYISFGGGFWTTTAGTAPLTAKNLGFDYNNDDAYGGDFRKEVGLSVRLISDTPATTTSTTTLAPSGFNTIYTHFESL